MTLILKNFQTREMRFISLRATARQSASPPACSARLPTSLVPSSAAPLGHSRRLRPPREQPRGGDAALGARPLSGSRRRCQATAAQQAAPPEGWDQPSRAEPSQAPPPPRGPPDPVVPPGAPPPRPTSEPVAADQRTPLAPAAAPAAPGCERCGRWNRPAALRGGSPGAAPLPLPAARSPVPAAAAPSAPRALPPPRNPAGGAAQRPPLPRRAARPGHRLLPGGESEREGFPASRRRAG